MSNSTGTYTIANDMLTTTDNASGMTSSSGYCVRGNTLHALTSTSVSMGAMGQGTITTDIVGTKQQ